MITVIICSVNPDYLKAVTQNIADTIGVPYELIAVDNRSSGRGICSVYNEAAAKAKYDFLCFLHEDVVFHTQQWGHVICKLLSDNAIALVGVSGAVYKSAIAGSWVDCGKRHYRANTWQHQPATNIAERVQLNPNNELFSEVALIDGVCMATHKAVWQQHRFDDVLLKGFHGYDFDFSLSAGTAGKVVVTHEILLEHFSSGSFSSGWLKDTLLLHRKWRHALPRYVAVPGVSDPYSDYVAAVSLLTHLLRHKGFKKSVIHYYCLLVFKYFHHNRFRFTKTVMKYLFFHQTIQ